MLALLVGAAGGCIDFKQAEVSFCQKGSVLCVPVLGPITVSTASTSAGGTIALTVTAEDPHQRALKFVWTPPSTGTLSSPKDTATTSQVTWIAPGCMRSDSTPTVTVTVTNDWGLSASQRVNVSSTPACIKPVVSSSASHTLLVRPDGTLWAWGNNESGQLGDGTTLNRSAPVRVSGLSNIRAIAAGNGHSLAVQADGSLWAWGNNTSGQLGDGTTTGQLVPARVATISDVKAVTAGDFYSLALRNDGTVWAWGSNISGQLGDGTTKDTPLPEQVTGLDSVMDLSSASMCDFQTNATNPCAAYVLALREDGTVWAWGSNSAGQLGDGTTTNRLMPVQALGVMGVKAVSTGLAGFRISSSMGYSILSANGYSLALLNDGTVWSWGSNGYGQLGNGTTLSQTSPGPVAGINGVKTMTAGFGHALVTREDGSVWAWGRNNTGQLGNGLLDNSTSPTRTTAPTGMESLTAGNGFSVGVRADGAAWAWGSRGNGFLGDGTASWNPVPMPVSKLTHVTSIASHSEHALAVLDDGSLWTWGGNSNGQLGDGTLITRTTPVQVLNGVQQASGNVGYSLAIKTDGSLWAWGINTYGQLGDGTKTNHTTPVMIGGLSNVTTTAAGQVHALALHGGTVWAWGDNSNQQLGDGTGMARSTPGQIGGLTNIVGLAASSEHSLAVRSDGSVLAWGSNASGQLGDGTTYGIQPTPNSVPGLSGIKMVAVGETYSLALKLNGTVWAWGNNANGQLGDATTTEHVAPAPANISGVIALDSHKDHVLALKSDGTVWAWGNNANGQLGDGTTTNRSSPVKVIGLTGAAMAVAAGEGFSLALLYDGTVWAWGNNYQAQLGNGLLGYSALPVPCLLPEAD